MKISVVTISRNVAGIVDRTIRSVITQQYQDVEWIVVDGASTDGTVRSFERVGDRIHRLVSEPDSGIANALNKGFRLATGDAVVFVLAGDELNDAHTLDRLATHWDADRYEWATGAGVYLRGTGDFLFVRRLAGESASALVATGCRIQFGSTIILRETLVRLGGFNEDFRSSMDYELWIRLIRAGSVPQVLPFPVGRFYLGGTSSDLARRYREDRRARQLHNMSSFGLECRLWTANAAKRTARPLARWTSAYRIKERLRM